jgi:hypothetical protein
LEDVKSDAQAKTILDKTRAEWVIWSAGTSLSLQSHFILFFVRLS